VPQSQPALGGAPGAFVAVLAAARARGVTVTSGTLANLLYLADVAAAGSTGRALSGIRWRWSGRGPSGPALLAIEDELARGGVVERVPGRLGTWHLRLHGDPPAVRVSARLSAAIGQAVADYGHLDPSALLSLTFQTEPVIEARREGSIGDTLDLLANQPVPDITQTLHLLSAVLDQIEPQADEGDLQGLADEIDSWAGYRAAATDLLLTDE
jgi:hypothetical protein